MRPDEHRSSDPDTLIVLACAGALVSIGMWALVLFLPYVDFGTFTSALVTDSGSLRDAAVAPRVVGIVLVAGAASVTLALPHRKAAWWTVSGALLGLAAFSAYWWAGSAVALTSGRVQHGLAWYLDGVTCLLALVSVAAGAVGAVDHGGRSRAVSAPYVAVAAGVATTAVLVLMGRNRAFIPVVASTDQSVWGEVSWTLRLVGVATTVVIVALPVLAAMARSRGATYGLTLGWLLLLAPLVTEVIVLRPMNPDDIGVAFTSGAALAGLVAVGLLVWAQVARRPGPEQRPRRRPA